MEKNCTSAATGQQPTHDDEPHGYDDDVSADTGSNPDVHSGGPIYSHGYVLRVTLGEPRERALDALARLEWERTSGKWRHAKLKSYERWILRGSTFVTHSKPRNARLPMAQFNKAWKTNLYSMIIDDGGETIALTFHGVRRRDVERVLNEVMGLGPADYRVDHYTALERYFVLAPHEAYRLADALDSQASSGSGRASRKRFLVRDREVPMVVGERARRTARLTIYRISGGATAQFKVELRLKGRTRDRQQFAECDIPRLDAVLEALIDANGLDPATKPARWEPVAPREWRRDGRLALIGWKAYRGTPVQVSRIRVAQACHTPTLVFSTGSASGSLTSLRPDYIRQSPPGGSPSAGTPSTCGHGHPGWRRLVEDVDRFEGYLSEIILGPNQDPAPCIQALIDGFGDRVGIGVIADGVGNGIPDTWGSISPIACIHPLTADSDVLVLLIDFSVVLAVEGTLFIAAGESLTRAFPGPLLPHYWDQAKGGLPPWEKAVAALFSPLFAELRVLAERSGMRIVTVTTDIRPEHGRRELVPNHRYRDGRVRSHIGDAGRYYAHLRYFIDSDARGRPLRVTLGKDEGEGLPGRLVWG